ncbi:type II secretion system protein N [Sphingomonas sp. 28-63-12]|uniref:type II secretion system protein N n=1 Tax=Sphingomonas sp. 28-63-12 TaxID=1970434 RepID=UPI000BD6A01D|nr:MAG: type II secretion system protein N [Sphingomonas sp. 28-63-12]
MKIRLNTRPAVLFGAMLVVALIALVPMRLVLLMVGLGDYGLSARSVTGPVWFSRLNEAHVGDLDLGDIRARLSPLPLLFGRVRIDLAGIGPAGSESLGAAPLHGAITTSRHSFGIDGMTASVASGGVFAPLPVTRIDLDAVSVKFDDGACAAADGRIKAQLSGAVAGIPLSQGMSGVVRCDAGAVLVPLVSQAGTEAVTLRIKGDGRYRATLAIQSPDPAIAQKLMLVGFLQNGAGYALSIEGRF